MPTPIEALELQVQSSSQSASKGLDALSATLKKVKSAVGNGVGISAVAKQTNSLSSSSVKAATSYVNLAAKLGVTYASLRKMSHALSSWIDESNRYIEDLNLFTVSMGEYAEEAQEYAERVSEIMGIDPSEWMRNQGIFNTITKGFGVANDRAYIMSKNLTQLAYDLSSFFNLPYEEAFQKLQSGIAGELEPLRRLGYDLSVARLQQEAYTLGINKSVSAMTQAEKSELRYYAIMTQVTAAQGDMARTLTAPANQMRVLQAQITQCARALGNIFIPVVNAVLPYAIALAKVIRMVASEIASFFGFELPEVDYGSGADSLGELAGSAGDAASGLSDAAENAKKLKRSLIGIDELTILPSPDTGSDGSSGGAGGVGGGGGLGFDLPGYDFLGNAVNTRVDEIVGQISDIVDKVKGAIANGDWEGAGTILANAINDIFDGVPYEDAGRKLGEIIQNGIEFALGFVRTFDWESTGGGFASSLNGLFDGINSQDLGALFASKIRSGIDFAYGFVTTFKWDEFGVWCSGLVNGWFDEIDWAKAGTTLSEGLKGVLQSIDSYLDATDFEAVGQKIGQFLAALDWKEIFKSALEIVGDIGGALKDTIVGIFEEADFSDILGVIGAILAIKLTPKLLSVIFHPFELMKNLAKMGGLSSGGEAASAIQSVTDSTSNVTLKLKDLATNLGWGIVIIGEVAVAAGLVVGAVWGLGALLDQVGQAWEPVIERGWVVAEDILLGSAVLVAVGAAAYGLGYIGSTAAPNIGIGTLILAEIGIATGLFIAEVWAIGKGLQEIGEAWQPVLDNGDTIKTGILTGTGLLTGIGIVTAALGAVTIGTAGALPLAIGVGTAMLVELSAATVLFTESLVAVADEMTDNLAPALSDFNEVLPGLSENMESFATYMGQFAGAVVAYAGDTIVAGISGAVADIVTFFTGDPLTKFTGEVDKTWKMLNGDDETEGLDSLLKKTNPVLERVATNAKSYVTSMGQLSQSISDYSGNQTVSAIGSAIETIKGWFSADPLTKFKNEVDKTYTKIAGGDDKGGLDAILEKTYPILEIAAEDVNSYFESLGTFASTINTYAGSSCASDLAGSAETVKGWFESDPFGTLSGIVGNNYAALAGTSGVFGMGSSDGLNAILEKVIPELQTAYTGLSSYVGYLDLISETTSGADFSGISDAIFVDMTGVGSNLVAGFSQGIADAGGVGSPVIGGLSDMLINIDTYDWYSVGTNIGTGIVNGMYNIGQPLAAWGQAVLDEVQRMFEINSPSDVWADEVGYYMGAGVGVGFEKATPYILSTIAGVSDEMRRAFTAADMAMTADTAFPVNTDMHVQYDNSAYTEFETGSLADSMRDNTEETISVIYAAAQQIIQAINEKDSNVYMDGRRMSQGVTDMQERRSKMLGKSPSFV